MRKFVIISLFVYLPIMAFTQDIWDLPRCVQYALTHNISVRQSDVQARIAAIQLKASKAMQIPTLGFNTQGGYNFGRSVDPTSNQFTTNRVLFQSYSLQSGVTLFNFFKVSNTIKADQAQYDAGKMDVERAKSDVTLNVAAAYLQYLLSKEQVDIAKTQIELSTGQLDLTRKQVAAGSVPELNAAQLESQLATDSSTLITNVSTMNLNKLQLLALLNLSADTEFEVSLPDADKIPLEPISELDPRNLYQLALSNQNQQKVDSLRILSARYAIKSAKAGMLPSISAFASVGSNYASSFMNQTGSIPIMDTIGTTNVGGTNYYTVAGVRAPIYSKTSYSNQIFNTNLSQAIGISLNIPIFNNRQARSNFENAKENLTNLQLTKELDNQKLQQDIYTAYNNAQTGIENYNANTKAETYAAYAYNLAKVRFDNGMSSTSDFLIAQNNLYKARINRSTAHYEYIFRLKVLEYYKFNHINL